MPSRWSLTIALVLTGCSAGGSSARGDAGDPPRGDAGAASESPFDAGLPVDAAIRVDAWQLLDADTCPPAPNGCALPTGSYVPELAGEFELVWVPGNGRYINEPTLIRDGNGLWHVLSNGGSGTGDPWTELSILHATAPSLLGPWTEQPDVLSTSDPASTDTVMWAPFVMLAGSDYLLLYANGGNAISAATSTDLFHFTRETTTYPGGRDPFVLRRAGMPDGLYGCWTDTESDGIHDIVALFQGQALAGWGAESYALHNPVVCPDDCWGWYESPYVVTVGGQYFLFVTFTNFDEPTYENTVVFRSPDPKTFPTTPIATFQAHGGELHVENGVMYLTRGGWPSRIGEEWRGLSLAPIRWKLE